LWPPDIATLKQSDSHSEVELATIAGLLDDVEARFVLPFGDPAPKAPSEPEKPAETPTGSAEPIIDEGPEADKTNISDLRRMLAELPEERKTWIQAQTKRANSAGHPISLKQLPSLRRYHIAQFLIAASTFSDDDLLRAVLRYFTTQPLDTGKAIGYVLGTIPTADLAARMAAITLAINAGDIIFGYDDDGTPSLTGPVDRYQPNPT